MIGVQVYWKFIMTFSTDVSIVLYWQKESSKHFGYLIYYKRYRIIDFLLSIMDISFSLYISHMILPLPIPLLLASSIISVYVYVLSNPKYPRTVSAASSSISRYFRMSYSYSSPTRSIGVILRSEI